MADGATLDQELGRLLEQETFVLPPTNHLANGGFDQSST